MTFGLAQHVATALGISAFEVQGAGQALALASSASGAETEEEKGSGKGRRRQRELFPWEEEDGGSAGVEGRTRVASRGLKITPEE